MNILTELADNGPSGCSAVVVVNSQKGGHSAVTGRGACYWICSGRRVPRRAPTQDLLIRKQHVSLDDKFLSLRALFFGHTPFLKTTLLHCIFLVMAVS